MRFIGKCAGKSSVSIFATPEMISLGGVMTGQAGTGSAMLRLLTKYWNAWLRMIKSLLAAMVLFSAALGHSTDGRAETVTQDDKIRLFSVLADFIDSRSFDGKFEMKNWETGETRQLTLKKYHRVLFEQNKIYVLCADFIDDAGNEFLVDFFLSRDGAKFRVLHYLEGQRPLISRIFQRLL